MTGSDLEDNISHDRFVFVTPAFLSHLLKGKVSKLQTSGKFRQQPCLFHFSIIGIKK